MYKQYFDFLDAIPNDTQKSEKWLENRRKKLTSSDLLTVLGINKYKKPVEVLLEKCGAGRTFFGNESTAHGELFEDEAIRVYEFLMGKKNHTYGLISYSDLAPIRPPESTRTDLGFIAGSPDGVAEDVDDLEEPVLVEVKCPLHRKIVHGHIPDHYVPQVQMNMFILDLKVADFIEYVPGTEINIVRVFRDDAWLERNVGTLKAFWADVEYWSTRDIREHPEYSKYYSKRTLKYKFMD